MLRPKNLNLGQLVLIICAVIGAVGAIIAAVIVKPPPRLNAVDNSTHPAQPANPSPQGAPAPAYQSQCVFQLGLSLREGEESSPFACENLPPGKKVRAEFRGSFGADHQQGWQRWIDVGLHEVGKTCAVLRSCSGRLIDQQTPTNSDIHEFGVVPSEGPDRGRSSWVIQVLHCERAPSTADSCSTMGNSTLRVYVVD